MCQTQHDLSKCSVLSDLSRNTHLAMNTLGLAVCPLTCVAAQDRPHTAPWLLWCRQSPPTSLLALLRDVSSSVSRAGSVNTVQAEPRPAPGAGGRAAPSFAVRKPGEEVGNTPQGRRAARAPEDLQGLTSEARSRRGWRDSRCSGHWGCASS